MPRHTLTMVALLGATAAVAHARRPPPFTSAPSFVSVPATSTAPPSLETGMNRSTMTAGFDGRRARPPAGRGGVSVSFTGAWGYPAGWMMPGAWPWLAAPYLSFGGPMLPVTTLGSGEAPAAPAPSPSVVYGDGSCCARSDGSAGVTRGAACVERAATAADPCAPSTPTVTAPETAPVALATERPGTTIKNEGGKLWLYEDGICLGFVEAGSAAAP